MSVLKVLIGALKTVIIMWDLTRAHVMLDSGSIPMDMVVMVNERLSLVLFHIFNIPFSP